MNSRGHYLLDTVLFLSIMLVCDWDYCVPIPGKLNMSGFGISTVTCVFLNEAVALTATGRNQPAGKLEIV